MSEVINSIFGRSQHDTTRHGGFVPTSTTTHTAEPGNTPESVDTTGIAVDETVEPTGEAATDVAGDADLLTGTVDENETTGTLTHDTDEGDAEDTDEGDAADTAETDAADTAEETDEAATDDSVELVDEDGEPAEEPESDDSGELAESSASIDEAGEQGPENIDDAGELAEEAEITDEDEPVVKTVESGDAPVAEAVEADAAPAAIVEAGEDDVEQAEPVTEARAAAATRGDTTVDDGVVAKVVEMLVRKAEGVHSLEDTSISVDGDVVTIKVSVVLEFGQAVKAVAGRIRTSVIDAVEEFLGLDVAAVDVRITDVYLSDAS
jgi:uncharacterized alkaline shock family protein YloU